MTKYSSEAAVLDALGMQSWRNLSKERFFQFLAMMPDIDNEVALKLIGQLPEFTKFVRAAVDDAVGAYRTALTANDRGMDMVGRIGLERLAILRAELERDLTPQERVRVLDEIKDVHEDLLAKDTENKRFLDQQVTKVLGVAVAAVVAALVFVGARVFVQSGGGQAVKA